MTASHERIMELWKAGKFSNVISHFGQWIQQGLLGLEELPRFWELIEAECQENAEVMFNLYEMLKRARNWNDEALYRELRISDKALEDVKNSRKPEFEEAVSLKMLYELLPQIAV